MHFEIFVQVFTNDELNADVDSGLCFPDSSEFFLVSVARYVFFDQYGITT